MAPSNADRKEIPDSDDEDNALIASQDDEQQEERGSQPASSHHEPHNVNCEASTGSTDEYFQGRLCKAERALVNASTDDSTQDKQTKRRHSLDGETATTSKPERKQKRLKSLPSSESQTLLYDDPALALLRHDQLHPDPSRAAHFSDSLGHLTKLEFVEHEPAMFHDSGSTIPDTESSQLRKYGPQADPNGALLHDSARNTTQPSAGHSSPFPLSMGNPTQTSNGKSRRAGTDRSAAISGGTAPDSGNRFAADVCEYGASTDIGHNVEQASQEQPTLNQQDQPDSNEKDGHEQPGLSVNAERFKKPQSSPVVEIPIVRSSTKQKTVEPQQQNSSRKTKSKEQQDVVDISSDDYGGYAKEQYVPRLSKRRSTQIAQQAIDYSVVPEKAAKAKNKPNKRRKTAGDRGAVPNLGPLPKDMNIPQPMPVDVDELRQKSQAIAHEDKDAAPEPETVVTDNVNEQDMTNISSQITVVKSAIVEEVPPAAPSSKSTSSQEKRLDKDGFAIPSPIPKSNSRSRRHHTTIFEDLTNFQPIRKSPTLTQQQKQRSEALTDLPNVLNGKKQRNRTVVANSDEEDEPGPAPMDENTAAPEEQLIEVVEEPRKKRGRGRPPKNARNEPVKPDEIQTEPNKDPSVESEAPGKSPKKKAAKKAARKEPETPIEVDSDTTDESMEPPQDKQVEKPVDEPPPQSTPTEDGCDPAPARFKSPAETSTTKQARFGQTSPSVKHTPLSHSSSAPFRVGLSRRQRIPSLLRMRKPVPPKKVT